MKILTLTLLTLSVAAQARVFETDVFNKVTVDTPPADTLVVFDIDNTLIRPRQTLGSDQWGRNEQKHFADLGLPADEVIDRGVAEFAQVQLKTQVQLVDTGAPEYIQKLQQKGYKILGLTARPLNLVDHSFVQLASVGIDLSSSAVSKTPLQLTVKAPAIYRNGILFVGPHNDKGESFKALFATWNKALPKHIIFFDDRESNVTSLETALAPLTDFVGYRFSGADDFVNSFDAKVGDLQWLVFQKSGVILSDAEAQDLLKQGPQKIGNPTRFVEAEFAKELAANSDVDSRSHGCAPKSAPVQALSCKGYITMLQFGGHRIKSNVREDYFVVAAPQGGSYLIKSGDLTD